MRVIDLKTTLEQTNGRITVDYLAKQTARGGGAVRKWISGGKIPETVINRLIEVLQKNDVEIIYKDE